MKKLIVCLYLIPLVACGGHDWAEASKVFEKQCVAEYTEALSVLRGGAPADFIKGVCKDWTKSVEKIARKNPECFINFTTFNHVGHADCPVDRFKALVEPAFNKAFENN
jgi:hypothetical protein